MVTNLDKAKAVGFLTAGLDPIMGKKLRSSLYDMPPKSLNDIYVRGESIRRKMETIGDTPKEGEMIKARGNQTGMHQFST